MATYIPVGVQTKYFGKLEATFDTVSAFVAGDALPLISLEITPTKEFINSRERVGTASLQRRVAGGTGGTWTATFYMKPNGTTVTTEPDCGALMKAATGAVDTSATVKYKFNDGDGEIETVSTLQLARHSGKGHYEMISGCWVESMDLEFNTNAENTITVSGGFASYGFCFGAKVTGSHSAAATTIDLDTVQILRVKENAYIQFDDAGSVVNQSGAGYLVTAVSASGDTATISPGLETGIADDTEIQPFTPAQTLTTNNPIFGTSNSFYISALSSAVNMTSGKVSISTGYHALASDGQAGKPTRVARGERSVTGDATFYLVSSDDHAVDTSKILGIGVYDLDLGIEFRAGTSTKEALKVSLPKADFNVFAVSSSETDEATFSASVVAKQNSAAGDECVVDFW